jgi:hypothetical protein
MAILYRLRSPLPRGVGPRPESPVRRVACTLARFALVLGAAAYGCDAPPELQPDQLLQDSLGLGPVDRVYTVELRHRRGDEVPTPDSLAMDRAGWVDFRTLDGWPRRVYFLTDSLPPGGAAFLDSLGTAVSPPFVSRGTRWPISFQGAPPGVYPYRVESGGGEGRGVVVVPER